VIKFHVAGVLLVGGELFGENRGDSITFPSIFFAYLLSVCEGDAEAGARKVGATP
jgi:hypothetical protein